MNVCYNREQMSVSLKMAVNVSKEYPVVVSSFMQNAREIEFDAVAQDGVVVEHAISNMWNLQEYIQVMQHLYFLPKDLFRDHASC